MHGIFILSVLLAVAYGQPYNYHEVLQRSIMFYEAQRSGYLPPNNRIPYRGNSAVNDGSDVGVDLEGGWYDAGDYVKYGLPMAAAVTTLAYGVVEFPEAYVAGGEMQNMLDCLRWPLNYFMKAHVSDNEFWAQVAEGDIDHSYWGRPEEMTMQRPSWRVNTTHPGSDVAGETAAALAASSMVFRQTDMTYSNLLLDHARRLYSFAYNYRGKYSDVIPDADKHYKSSGYNDELCYGAAWLYRATNENQYLDMAREFYSSGTPWGQSWDSKEASCQMLLYQLTGEGQYRTAVENYIRSWMPGGSVQYTPKGLAFRSEWGSLRYMGHTTFIALLAADNGINTQVYTAWAQGQIHYALGDGGRSYVCGYGENPPHSPHHGSSSCDDLPAPCNWNDFNKPGPNPQILWGALVGGPGENDDFVDDRTDYVKNEVTTEYNAGFHTSIAALQALTMKGIL